MAETRTVYGTINTMATTNLQSLASNATTRWLSTEVSNVGDKWDDASVEITLDFANTAPANSQAAFVFVDGRNDPFVMDMETVSTSQPDVTTGAVPLRLLARIPYRVAGQVVRASVASVAAAFGGLMPPVWRIVVVNHSGAALKASGNVVTWRGVRTEIV